MRGLLLALAAAVLPACHEHKIWVSNAGTSGARVDVRYSTENTEPITGISWRERHHDSWVVAPGEVGEKGYPYPTLELTISEELGGAVLFKDDLDIDDFRDEHSRIELTVYP